MANVTVTVRVVDDDPSPALVDGVLVRVFDAPGDSYITEGTTGSVTPGEVDFTLFGNAGGVGYTFVLSKSGVSFPPAPTKQGTVYDPPAPSNLFQFTAHVGPTAELVTLAVKTDELTPQPVEGVTALVFDGTDTYLTELETDSAGEAILALDGDPDPGRLYIVRLRPLPGQVVVDGITHTIYVHEPLVSPATNIFDFTVSEEELPASTDPNMCLMSGTLVDQALRPLSKVNLRFMPLLNDPEIKLSGFPFPTDPAIIQRQVLLREAVFQTGPDGKVQVLLPRKAIYEVHIHGFELPGTFPGAQIQVPDSAGAQLEDVLFPYVATVEWSTDTVALAVDDTEQVTVSSTGSNDQDIQDALIGGFLEFVVDDPAVAEVSFDDGVLSITGLAAGVAQITAVRVEGTYAPRVPDVPDLITAPSTSVTVTVT
jgi:hypothetical protein